ncbi:MAG: hypothetical protein ABEJ22_05810 [Haloferacaceae archaeon]
MDASRLPVECPICHEDVSATEIDLVDHLATEHTKRELAGHLRALVD